MTQLTGIRVAEPGDAAEIARLCRELGYPATAADIHDRLLFLLKVDTLHIAVAPGPGATLLGWVAVEHRHRLTSGESAAVVGLVVDAASRRHGVGRALVSAAAHWAESRGLGRLTVRSDVGRTGSHAFYRGLGFSTSKTQHTYVKRLFPE